MGWPRKNEGARLYKLPGPTYILILESDGYYDGCIKKTFKGPYLTCFGLHELSRWTVKRQNAFASVYFNGYLQEKYLATASRELSDDQLIQSFLEDQGLEEGVTLVDYKGGVPETYGGSAKRVSWDELPNVWKRRFLEVVGDPAKHRGLWRMQELERDTHKRWNSQQTLPVEI
jgi:hypothetical protein